MPQLADRRNNAIVNGSRITFTRIKIDKTIIDETGTTFGVVTNEMLVP